MIQRTHFLLLASLVSGAAQIPAFPGAEGFGAYSTGGRGGDVYYVTNLNPSGTGSFADAIATVPSSGRTIVFAVSGYIRFPSGSGGTRLTKGKVTIAGQTAPGDGIGFYNNFFRVSASDVLIRHIRFRHGKDGSGGDCVDLDSACSRAMLDHVSMQFSTDENMSSYNSPPDNVTLQYSLNGWGLESHSCGGLWDQNHATALYTLWSHNHTRNPKARPVGLLDWINNVTYDWDIGFIMGDSDTPIDWKSNVLGNYFVCPPGNLRSRALEKASLDRNGNPNFTIFVENNLFDKNGNNVLDGSDYGYGIASGSYATSPTRMPSTAGTTVVPVSPRLAYKKVVSSSGALRLDATGGGSLRDEVDTLMVDNLITLKRNHISDEASLPVSNSGFGTLNSGPAPLDTDRDGMSDAYESALGWNPATKDNNTLLANSGGFITGTTYMPAGTPAGYTRLEEYLHFLGSPHAFVAKNTAGTPASITVDLSRYTLGFNPLNPSFSISTIVSGAAVLSGVGNRIVTFTPTLNLVGRARFEFTVTDSQGDTWTQSFLFLVTSSGLPRDLAWKGNGSTNTWNTSTANWYKGDGTTTAFASGDNAIFDDRGSASPAISLPSNIASGTLTFDTTKDYTLSGAGALFVGGPFTKRGSGSITLSSNTANSFGSIVHEAGGLALTKSFAAGGTKIQLNGGTLILSPDVVGATVSNPFEFNETTVIDVTTQHESSGAWTGPGDVTINTSAMWTITGSWSGYSGRITLGPTGTPRVRLNGNSNTNFGSANLAIDLGQGSGQFYNRNGATINIGTLTGGTNTQLLGTQTGTAASTYSVGARGEDAIFQGSVRNGVPGGVTHLAKVGSGIWTLAGASTHTGTTAVSAGSVLLNGSFASSPVVVSSGATFGGAGTSGAAVTVNSGGYIAPGAMANQAGTLTTAGLTVAAGTIRLDLDGSTAGANDKIVVNSGTTALTGAVKFEINRLADSLQAGLYQVIGGASSLSTSSFTPTITGLPGTTRQTFSIQTVTSPGTVNLLVTGNAGSLTWTGSNGAIWDVNTTGGNWTGASPDTFRNLDLVTFADGAANPAVNLTAAVQPALVTVENQNQNFTMTGGGSIAGAARMVKNGTGSFTIGNSTANSFTGGVELNAGKLVINSTASPLGSGLVAMNGGTMELPVAVSIANSVVFSGSSAIRSFANSTVVSSPAASFSSSGVATVDLSGSSGIFTINAPMSGFSGTIDLGSSSVMFRLNGSDNVNVGSASTHFALGTGSGRLVNRNSGLEIDLGALSGGPSTRLEGRQTGSGETESIYRIGALDLPTGFAGTITEGGDLSGVRIIKTGSADLTLSGTSNFIGSIGVESGSLTISGSTATSGNCEIDSGGALAMAGGTLGAEVATIAGSLTGYGAVNADLSTSGSMIGRGFSSGTPGILQVYGNASFNSGSTLRMLAGAQSDALIASGDISISGTVEVALSPGTEFGRYSLMSCGGNVLMDAVSLTGIPVGTTAHLSTSVPGKLDLVIDDSDEDNLPDSWEMQHFVTLAFDADSDPDGDGQNNATELLTGTDPADGSSSFAATIAFANGEFTISWPSIPDRIYHIESVVSLDDEWSPLITVPGASEPAVRTSHAIPPDGTLRFYRVVLQPF